MSQQPIIGGDPRIYGFDLEGGLSPNTAFEGDWGESSVPDSDGGGEVLRTNGGGSYQLVQEQPPQPQPPAPAPAPMTAQVPAQPLYAAPNTVPLYQQPPTGQQAQITAQTPAQPLYAPPNTVPLYKFEGQSGSGAGGALMQPYPAAFAGVAVQTPQPLPPRGHLPQHYPWQGHPEAGAHRPYTGPDGTMPMRRGDPNLPSYATAPQPPQDYTGAGYPLSPRGTYVPVNGQPPPGAYAGIDFGALDEYLGDLSGKEERQERRSERKADKADKSRTVTGKGGWGYRQYKDGTIEITVSQHRSLPVGTKLTAQSHPKAWNAITAEIGTWDQYRQERLRAAGTAALSLTAAAGGAASSLLGKKKRRRRGRRRRQAEAAPPPEGPSEEGITEEPAEEGLPPWAIPVGLALVGGLIFFVASSGDKKEGKGKG